MANMTIGSQEKLITKGDSVGDFHTPPVYDMTMNQTPTLTN